VIISVNKVHLNLILPNHFRHDVDQTGIREVKRSQMVVSLKTRPLRFEITINGATSYLWIARSYPFEDCYTVTLKVQCPRTPEAWSATSKRLNLHFVQQRQQKYLQ